MPGTVAERGADRRIYNTALAITPDGDLAAAYRKIFPWRPFEPFTPGGRFVVFDLPGVGRIGMAVCYDLWFPEVARNSRGWARICSSTRARPRPATGLSNWCSPAPPPSTTRFT